MALVNPKTIKTFLDDILSGGGNWQKLDSDLKLKEIVLGGAKDDL